MNEAHESCDGCKHDLGGGRDNCRLNLTAAVHKDGLCAYIDVVAGNELGEYI